MGLKPDHWIRKMAQENGMIEPFVEKQVRQDIISYGLSSYGYDVRVSNQYKIFTNAYSAIVDPKNFDTKSFVDFEGDVCIIPPNSFVLARSIEYMRVSAPRFDHLHRKSSYARCGLIVNVTPLEPSWHGHITLEISNTTPLPARVYSHEGVAQLVFLEADEECEISYADRQGKYQGQTGVTLPRI